MYPTPAVSPQSWIWWADEPCESAIGTPTMNESPLFTSTNESTPAGDVADFNHLELPPPNFGISLRQPAFAPQNNILTEIDDTHSSLPSCDFVIGVKPKNIDDMTPDELEYWKLKNIFNHIYVTIQRAMRLWIDPCWKPVIDACFWSTIELSGGDPRVSNASHRNVVRIDEALDVISCKFGEPNVLFVTCAQWRKYTALINALSRIQVTVREYEYMRANMAEPGDFICVRLTELFPSIDRDRYFINQSECFDYDNIENPAITYPWPA